MSKLLKCKTCGADIAATAKACPSCGAKSKKPFYKAVWFWLLMIFVVIPAFAGIVSSGSDVETPTPQTSDSSITTTSSTSSKNSAFEGNCGISASAEMGSSIIDFPQLTVSITNTSEKAISAIQFYAVPYDVYGEEITGWTSQNKLYTDSKIPVGKTTSIDYQFIEDSVKKVRLYVYSVLFEDGTQWGNKDATKSAIIKNGTEIEVLGES